MKSDSSAIVDEVGFIGNCRWIRLHRG